MLRKSIARLTSLLMCCLIIAFSVFSVTAIDDTYEIADLGLSIRIPKEYTVITRTTDKNDEAFSALKLDYDATMNAFYLEHIYLQAVSEDEKLKFNLTAVTDENSKAVNNYSDLSAAQRQEALSAFMKDGAYESGVELKHNDSIFFDFELTTQGQNNVVFAYQCHTVVNGMNINLTMQKNGESFTADEVRIVTNMADSIDFDEIYLKNGPSFEWWRFLLWILILVLVSVVASYFYKRRNKSRRNIKNRKSKQRISEKIVAQNDGENIQAPRKPKSESKLDLLMQLGFEDNDQQEEKPVSFDEMLGYDTTDYHTRANSEFDTFDVKVKGNNQSHFADYFEDDGKDINNDDDYFNDFFTEKTQKQNEVSRGVNNVLLYIKLGFRRLGYFFTNLWRMIFPSKKTKRTQRKK